MVEKWRNGGTGFEPSAKCLASGSTEIQEFRFNEKFGKSNVGTFCSCLFLQVPKLKVPSHARAARKKWPHSSRKIVLAPWTHGTCLEEDEIVTQSYDNDEMGTTSTPPPPPVHDDDEPQQQLKQKEQSDVARVLSWTRMPAATGGRSQDDFVSCCLPRWRCACVNRGARTWGSGSSSPLSLLTQFINQITGCYSSSHVI
uniref:HDC15807 n=1 Tax=Drosophila melanogaster TaxID=7227 RepID=Q6IJ63_DROME|nr:TPA_inf: HDC15807 [Drosophila melanogaster]